jgi:SET domain-containing protein
MNVALTDLVVFNSSPIHGIGGFAREDIAAGTRVIEYVGEKITKEESLARCEGSNEYIFAIDDSHDLDGNVEGNPARFLNHSCEPNCEAQFADGRIWIVSIREVRAGEELTFNYSYDLADYREHPCRCGAESCVGYIVAEEYFEHVRRQGVRRDTDL